MAHGRVHEGTLRLRGYLRRVGDQRSRTRDQSLDRSVATYQEWFERNALAELALSGLATSAASAPVVVISRVEPAPRSDVRALVVIRLGQIHVCYERTGWFCYPEHATLCDANGAPLSVTAITDLVSLGRAVREAGLAGAETTLPPATGAAAA
jgi:hypothetical protein